MAKMTRTMTMSRDSRLTTHASLDEKTQGRRESQKDRRERERSASWDRSQQPRSELSLSEAKEEWNETDAGLRQRLKDLGLSGKKEEETKKSESNETDIGLKQKNQRSHIESQTIGFRDRHYANRRRHKASINRLRQGSEEEER